MPRQHECCGVAEEVPKTASDAEAVSSRQDSSRLRCGNGPSELFYHGYSELLGYLGCIFKVCDADHSSPLWYMFDTVPNSTVQQAGGCSNLSRRKPHLTVDGVAWVSLEDAA